ncbi:MULTISPECIES: methyltransferase domain-containing protein [unclassified Flavobacterium]|uniref:methyltransferase domain-containing protein n=1 Tax=unclassified Flavobacterium TaxID=196869 RepID=UPI001F13B62F|nr:MULTISPECIES: methyltransferase domain-containing protein [unclassified Flavobacterium]UMY65710.1 class I SAM-dependent methyltransferase [Flavobacterium sp. HJ-32-4]
MELRTPKPVHPDTQSREAFRSVDIIRFEDGSELPVYNGVPILFGADSLFSADDIREGSVTTQDAEHLNTGNYRNYIRRKLLPSLADDTSLTRRYRELNAKLPQGGVVLVVGTGEKADFYRETFPGCQVVTSDVHAAFRPDYVFDGHRIPFEDEVFDLVLAAQVIEHTVNPWQFSAELQRVTRRGGLLQIEAPHNFPYHAEPYDFFRFTYTGMRSLFRLCAVEKAYVTEGNASVVALAASNFLVNISRRRIVRSGFLLVSRFVFGWLKYLDRRPETVNRRTISMPKGYAFTFRKDARLRSENELFSEFHSLAP